MPRRRSRSRRTPDRPPRVRQTLLAAAESILEREGPTGLTWRAIAREAGVSHNAAYYYFESRGALLAAVAARAFDDLRRAVDAVAARTRPAGRRRAGGLAYVRFALDAPQRFRLMFSPELGNRRRHPELEQSANAAFAALMGVVGLPPSGGKPAGAAAIGAAAAWSLVHGLAVLLVDRQIDASLTRAAALRLAERVLQRVELH